MLPCGRAPSLAPLELMKAASPLPIPAASGNMAWNRDAMVLLAQGLAKNIHFGELPPFPGYHPGLKDRKVLCLTWEGIRKS